MLSVLFYSLYRSKDDWGMCMTPEREREDDDFARFMMLSQERTTVSVFGGSSSVGKLSEEFVNLPDEML